MFEEDWDTLQSVSPSEFLPLFTRKCTYYFESVV
jgi:hypothetical protein